MNTREKKKNSSLSFLIWHARTQNEPLKITGFKMDSRQVELHRQTTVSFEWKESFLFASTDGLNCFLDSEPLLRKLLVNQRQVSNLPSFDSTITVPGIVMLFWCRTTCELGNRNVEQLGEIVFLWVNVAFRKKLRYWIAHGVVQFRKLFGRPFLRGICVARLLVKQRLPKNRLQIFMQFHIFEHII